MGNVPHFERGQTLQLRSSRRRWSLILLGCLAFVLVSVLIMGRSPGTAVMSMVVFGLGALIAAALLVAPSTLTLTDDGFTMRTLWRSRSNAWADVAQFGVSTMQVRGRTGPAARAG